MRAEATSQLRKEMIIKNFPTATHVRYYDHHALSIAVYVDSVSKFMITTAPGWELALEKGI